MKTRHHVAVQMEEEQQWTKDNGPIVKTADQLWKYSGKIEPHTPLIEHYIYQKNHNVDQLTDYIKHLRKKRNGNNNKKND
tara:strand:- start:809 stop:1048 length:240 start_codon:yes stop_codon:yes gene_type:complete